MFIIVNKYDLFLVHIKGAVEVYKQYVPGFLMGYYLYYWKVMGNNEFQGPFDSIHFAMSHYERYAAGQATIPAILPTNVVQVDFCLRRRVK
jgi:hypothetical protein